MTRDEESTEPVQGRDSRCVTADDFRFLCRKQWSELEEVSGENAVRYCGNCEQRVFWCATVAEAVERSRRAQCVAVAGPARSEIVDEEVLVGTMDGSSYSPSR